MSIVSNKQRNQTVTIDLLAFESETTFLLEPGVTTATFFKNTSFEKARQSLKTRYFEVLKANPWLAGRLIKQKGNQRVQLVYPQTVSGSNLETLFHDKEEIKIDLNTEYETIYKNITNNFNPNNTPNYIIPHNYYFFIGDNRNNSIDSRYIKKIGYIPKNKIIGRAKLLLLNLNVSLLHFFSKLKFNRFFCNLL